MSIYRLVEASKPYEELDKYNCMSRRHRECLFTCWFDGTHMRPYGFDVKIDPDDLIVFDAKPASDETGGES